MHPQVGSEAPEHTLETGSTTLTGYVEVTPNVPKSSDLFRASQVSL